MTERRLVSALIGILVVAALLANACGGDDVTPKATSESVASRGVASPIPVPLSGQVTVFAAASMTDAFTELAEVFAAANPEVDIRFNFAGSSALRTQIQEGAPADIFASANLDQMNLAEQAGTVESPMVFVRNSLTVIMLKDNPGGLSSLADLRKQGLKLVLAAPEVPVGGYALQVLQNMDADPAYGAGFSDAVLANLVSNENNVKQVVAKVQLGEADLGIVYGTDVTPGVANDLATIAIPDALNVIAEYSIAVTTEAKNVEAARAFVDFILGADGQAILRKWGFRTLGAGQ